MLREPSLLALLFSTNLLSKQTIITTLERSASTGISKDRLTESGSISTRASIHSNFGGCRTEDKIETHFNRTTPAAEVHPQGYAHYPMILNINLININ